jgi:lysyl-tRNA synthetase class 2
VATEATTWRPAASPDLLRLRAELLARIRAYFAAGGVLEVDTPVLSPAGATDPALRSFSTVYHGPGPCHGATLKLHTSPEFPMKRLLAAGIGSIYQICKVFRDGESGRFYSPEYMLLEWYRAGFDHAALMVDVELLLRETLRDILPLGPATHWTYRALFQSVAAIDPFATSADEIRQVLRARDIDAPDGLAPDSLDGWLDLLLTHVVEPALGRGLVFISEFPVSQAALARLLPDDPPAAARFEVYLGGIELANGYHELTDPTEQRQRFERDVARRRARRLDAMEPDERLLAALEAGLPDCAGVAMGIDRLVMIAGGVGHIDDVTAFPLERA